MPLAPARRLETAYRALQQYPIRPVLVTFLQHSENLTFRVDCADAVFLLRLHSPRTPGFGAIGNNRQAIESELLWLAALREEGLPVPAPVMNARGKAVSQVERIHATLLAWQEGELLTREAESEATAAQIGALVGRIHAHARQWTLPAGFTRPERDEAYFQEALHALWPAVRDGRITHPDYQTFETALGILHDEIRRLPRTPETWGLLHGDLHRGNFLLHEGKIGLIDFSMCAFGHFAYDLATCLSNVRQAFHPLFIENYTQFMPLPPNFGRLLEGYFVASAVATFALWVTDAQAQETLVRRVAYIAREYAARFNRDERFWFM